MNFQSKYIFSSFLSIMPNPFTIISSARIYENPWMRLDEERVEKDGKKGVFGITTLWDGVCVLVVDDEKNVLLVDEYKYALWRNDLNLPWWAIDKGESPLECAKRETEEEIGYSADEWISLWKIHPLTTIVRQTENLFLARKIKKTQKKNDEWENTKLIKLPYMKVLEMAMNSEITHSWSVTCILKAEKYINHA